MRLFVGLIAGCLLCGLPGCGGESVEGDLPDFAPRRPNLSVKGAPIGDQRAYAKGIRELGAKLYWQLDGKKANVVFSPFGVHASIAVLTHGMERAARDRVREVLDADLPKVRFESAYSSLLHRMDQDSDALNYFHAGTALWLQDGLTFKESFLRCVVDFHAQQLYASDFVGDADQVVDDMNEWASQQTGGWINPMVGDGHVSESTKLASTHVVVVKGGWHYAFDRSATRDTAFRLADGQSVNVPTMHLNAKLACAQTELWQVVYLPYRMGKHGMLILVPRKQADLSRAAETLDGKELAMLIDSLELRPVQLALPRFAFTSRLDLTKTIQALGMNDLFDRSGAAFTETITDAKTPIAIDTLASAVRVEVKEDGDKQPDASSSDADGQPADLMTIRCDQPFLFFVQHRPTGVMLLAGRVADPREQ